jgi:hypothetical protein
MEDLITYLVTTFGGNPYFQVVSAVVVLASAICAITPTPDPKTTWGKVYKFIELLALNIGKAKQ